MPNRSAEELGRMRQLAQTAASSERVFQDTDIMIDQEARDDSKKALALIEAHERICTERQGNILKGLDDLNKNVRGLYGRFWAGALSIIGMLAAAVATLAYFLLTHPH